MSRFLHSRYGLFACSLVLTLGMFTLTTGAGQAQVVVRPKAVPPGTVQKQAEPTAKQFVPRPKYPTEALLAPLNERIRKYAESLLGKQVGDGECWALANEVLAFCKAKQPGQSGYSTYEFGKEVALSAVIPGDILQFENVGFKNGERYPHHTAIVRKVNGRQIDLLHQNVNNVRTVQPGSINLDQKLATGPDPSKASTLKAYRPQPR